MNGQKTRLPLWLLLIVELIVCYLAILAVISYWRAPAQYRALPEETLLAAADFSDFAGRAVSGDGLLLQNNTPGNVAGYLAWLDLREVNPIAVKFALDCPKQYAGGVLHVDLWNEGYDNDAQEYKLALQEGINEVEIFLDKGADAPDSAQLRFFTVDLADYTVTDLRISRAEPVPKISSGLLAGMILCLVLLLVTAVALFRPHSNYLPSEDLAEWGALNDKDSSKEAEPVNGWLKNMVRRLVGWYVEPVYQQNAYLHKQLKQCQENLSDCRFELDKRRQQLDIYANLLVKLQQDLAELQKNTVSQSMFEEFIKDNAVRQDSTVNLPAESLDSKQAAMLYAYRYLLNREPDNAQTVAANQCDWRDLRQIIMDSDEYKILNQK